MVITQGKMVDDALGSSFRFATDSKQCDGLYRCVYWVAVPLSRPLLKHDAELQLK